MMAGIYVWNTLHNIVFTRSATYSRST